ncbi:bifunctional 2-polyprenyl-6-hydroxyphenol methylase/3-demethylubiquinol 3-O-methyltransferase UbiG [Paracoccus sp. MC1862]|uniref:class I SAM-dependent methyltransferase n=1 Tax=Paracoccus sp. MC1862 TaxID=2760307 RepID=UPI0016033EDB|nr:hypothetical protein [Paracoccus sp. MC1862]MBB1497428.1 hypothetical protein [Paracoccus sp. MC1862]QQO45914.1 hypothetical protein JGR78_06345 [Paracoccus sp. MC1862]
MGILADYRRINMSMAQRIADLGPWFQTLDFGNGILSPGRWNPRQQAAEIAGWIPGGIAGKSLLDVGSNAGGIGIGLAELGASGVTLLEKGERYHRQAELYLESRSLLPVQAVNGSAFDVHRMDRRDVTLWLGLVYHFRHPQLFLDYAAGCGGALHVVSTQATDLPDLTMTNRKRKYAENPSPLLGWEPTRELFLKMLALAGYDIISCHQRSGVEWTNNLYVVCKPPARPVCDLEAASRILGGPGIWS